MTSAPASQQREAGGGAERRIAPFHAAAGSTKGSRTRPATIWLTDKAVALLDTPRPCVGHMPFNHRTCAEW